MPGMEFILIWFVDDSGLTVRRVIGIFTEDRKQQVEDFRNAGWHVVLLWNGVGKWIK